MTEVLTLRVDLLEVPFLTAEAAALAFEAAAGALMLEVTLDFELKSCFGVLALIFLVIVYSGAEGFLNKDSLISTRT